MCVQRLVKATCSQCDWNKVKKMIEELRGRREPSYWEKLGKASWKRWQVI